jgi:hypothetical protein
VTFSQTHLVTLASSKNFIFQTIVNEILDHLMEDIGPIPGKYLTTQDASLFRAFITAQFKSYCQKKDLMWYSKLRTSTLACGEVSLSKKSFLLGSRNTLL